MEPNATRLALLLVTALWTVASCNALVGAPPAAAAYGDEDGSGIPEGGPEAAAADTGNPDASTEACCPGSAPTGCADLSSDLQNCGACGHSCEYAGCFNGLCEPVSIAGSPSNYRGLWSLYGLTLLNGQLYGTDWYEQYAAVYTVPTYVSVSDPDPLVKYEAGVSASPIANDGTGVFYAIYRDEQIPIPGAASGIYALDTAGNQNLVVPGPYVGTLEVDDKYLYWTVGHAISVAQKDGGGVATFSTGKTYLARIAARPGWPWVYFVQDGVLVRATPPRLDLVTSISGSDRDVALFAVDDTTIYWMDAPGDAQMSRMFSVPVSDPSQPPRDITPAAGIPAGVSDLLADPANASLYCRVTGVQSGQIYRLAKDGSKDPVLLVAENTGIGGWTQDDKAIYFTTLGSSSDSFPPYATIWRVHK